VSKLPDSWTMGAIADLVDVGPKNQCDDSTVVGFVPMNRMGKSFRDIPTFELRKWREVKKGYTHFAEGDVLVARITPCFENGKAGIARELPNGLGAGSTEYVVLRPKAGVATAEYVLARLKTDEFMSKGTQAMTGAVGQQRVPKAVIESYPVPIAPFPEQQRISLKLTALLADVDTCRERLDRVPQILKKFREAVLEAAVSGRLTEDWRAEKNGEPLGAWTSTKLSAVCESDRIITYGVIKLGADIAGGIPCLRTSNVRWLRVDEHGMKRIAPSLSAEYRRTVLRGDEVLVNVRGTLGGVSAVEPHMVGWNVSREVAVVPAARAIIQARFLALSIATNSSQQWLAGVQKGVAYTGINIEDLRALPVRVPSLVEQSEIVRRVDALFTLADSMQQRYDAVVPQVEALTPSVLAKAFRGELVPQDPNDEPAGEMLERIGLAPEARRSCSGSASGAQRKQMKRTEQKRRA
jgi:type I restriction enzyme S subunit